MEEILDGGDSRSVDRLPNCAADVYNFIPQRANTEGSRVMCRRSKDDPLAKFFFNRDHLHLLGHYIENRGTTPKPFCRFFEPRIRRTVCLWITSCSRWGITSHQVTVACDP
jgi:hypothetical protein